MFVPGRSPHAMTPPSPVALIHLVDLEKLEPERRRAHPDAIDGTPEEAWTELFDDGTVSVGVWECGPGTVTAERAADSEHMYVLSGEATVFEDGGPTIELRAGSELITPQGWTGRWEIHSRIRKIYTIWTRTP
jgi:uncharacterized cupin superfamily protein